MTSLITDNVLARLQRVKSTAPNKWQACCPAHEDRQASLSISPGDKGLLLKCFAGCSCQQICDALHIKPADLFYEQRAAASARRIVAEYNYTDAAGNLLYQVCRYDPKDFRQRRPEGNGWAYTLKGVERVLYRLPDVLAAVSSGETVYLPEGEKDVENLRALGLTATTNAQGAAQPFLPAYAEALRGADVVILVDNDAAGRDCRDLRVKALLKTARRLRVLELPGLAEHGDVSDWLNSGGTKAELLRLAERAPDVSPLNGEMQAVLAGLQEALKGLPVTVEANGLPTLAENATVQHVKSAIYKADTFGKRANVVINLFIGALAAQAGNTRNAQKDWAEAAFGKDANMRQHVRQCVLVFRRWQGVYDVNKHDWVWSNLLLASRQIFADADRRGMVERPQPPKFAELTQEIERRKMVQQAGVLTLTPAQQFAGLLKAVKSQRDDTRLDTLYRELNEILTAALMEDAETEEAGEETEESAEKQSVLETYSPTTYTPTLSQAAPETASILAPICCEFTTDNAPETPPAPSVQAQDAAPQQAAPAPDPLPQDSGPAPSAELCRALLQHIADGRNYTIGPLLLAMQEKQRAAADLVERALIWLVKQGKVQFHAGRRPETGLYQLPRPA